MSTDDDRAIDRFVAGAPVDADELATAITAKAVDRAIVVEALLKNLASDEPVVRRRAAERVARLPDLPDQIAARLTEMAVNDGHARAREACAAALVAHGRPVPGAPRPAEPTSAAEPRRWSLRVLITAARPARGADFEATIGPRYEEDAPRLRGRLYDSPAGARLELTGLPQEFAGTRPEIRAQRARGQAFETIARADAPVTPGGTVTMTVVAIEDATVEDVADWLSVGQLVVPLD
jgi:hypothetical protein